MKNRLLLFTPALVLCLWFGIAAAQTGQPYPADRPGERDGTSIPSGTQISVRTNEAIDSNSASEGQRFSAEVADDVKSASGEILVPKGSAAELSVSSINSGGTTSSSEVALTLHSVEVNGRKYLVSSEDVTQSGNQGPGEKQADC